MSANEHPSPLFTDPASRARLYIHEIWARLDRELAKKAPAAFETLRCGATEEEIRKLEKEHLNFRLPQDLRESLKCHNGQIANEIGFVNGFSLCTIEQMRNWQQHNAELLDVKGQANLAPGIYQGESLIGAMQFESEFIVVDCNGIGGKSGQLYVFEDGIFSDSPVESNWGQFLMTFLHKLSSGDQDIHLLDGIHIDFGVSF